MTDKPETCHFGLRTPLRSSDCFLGRKTRTQQVINAVFKHDGAEGAVVVGPPRSGRTSVLYQLKSEAERLDEHRPEVVVAIADMRGCESNAASGMEKIIDAIREATKARTPPLKDLADAIPRALARIPGRLVIAVDNFDVLAPYLRRDEQAVIRASASNDVAWVLTTAAPMTECLEFFGDRQSDVIDIVKHNTIHLEPLEIGHIQDALAECGLSPENAEAWAAFVHERVGGFAAWLQLALCCVLQVGRDRLEAGPRGMDAVSTHALEVDIRKVLSIPVCEGALALDARARLGLDQVPEQCKDEDRLRQAGFINTEHSWSGTIIEELASGRNWLEQRIQEYPRGDRYERLSFEIDRINGRSWRAGGTAVIEHGRVASRRVQPYLRRETKSRDDARALVDALAYLFTPATRKDPDASRLPKELSTKPDSPLSELAWLHDISRIDEGIINEVNSLVDRMILMLHDLEIQPTTAEDSRPLSWLHLSDIHMSGHHTYDPDLVLDAIVKLAEKERKPDFIVVTGDVAFSGQAKQYAHVDKFFSDLLDVTGLSDKRERVIVVPGNHDVDRQKLIGLARTLLHEEQSQSYFGLKTLPHLTAQSEFWSWYERLLAGARTCAQDTTCGPIVQLNIREHRVALLPINTALFASGDDDRDKLWIGRRALRAQVQELQKLKANLNIVALHHPVEWLSSHERRQIRKYIQDAADVILCGHLHEPGAASVHTMDSRVVMVSAGASYQGSRRPCRLFYCRLEQLRLFLRPFAYDDVSEQWLIDPTVFPSSPDHEASFPIR